MFAIYVLRSQDRGLSGIIDRSLCGGDHQLNPVIRSYDPVFIQVKTLAFFSIFFSLTVIDSSHFISVMISKLLGLLCMRQ